MLVFISDLHLTDGTTCKSINSRAFELFVDDLCWMTQQACWRGGPGSERSFTPLERVDLVLLGDIFDLLRSGTWRDAARNGAGMRPWTPEMLELGSAAEAHVQLGALVDEIVSDIVTHNGGQPGAQLGLVTLRRVAEQGIPVHGPTEVEHRIPLKIWYLVGNSDWPLHIALPAYDAARRRVIAALGLAHADASSFPHTLDDAPPELREVCQRHRVYAEHGDRFDPDNFPIERPEHVEQHRLGLGRRAHASLGDAIVIEVINPLPGEILAAMDVDDPVRQLHSFHAALDELNNVRPLAALPQWLASVLQCYENGDEFTPRRRQAVRKALDGALRRLLANPFVQRFDKPWHLDTVDALQVGAALNRVVSMRTLSKLTHRYEHQEWANNYLVHAEHELEQMRGRGVDTIVFGHTHQAEVVALDLEFPRGFMYLNVGTWRRVHRRCVAGHHRLEFLDQHVMSIVALYAGNERSGRPYETWTATLGVRPDAVA